MNPHDEAAQILIRMFETMAHGMGKRLLETHKAEIRRACALLATDATLEPLEDMARMSPAEMMVGAAQSDPNFKRWKESRER